MTIFHKILSGEIPSSKVFEDDFTFAFHDIRPQAPVHVLIIPKKFFKDFSDLDDETMVHMSKTTKKVAEIMGLDISGYRVVTNVGSDGGQEVPYVHFHLIGGKKLKWGNFVDDDSHKSM